jgi:geranylgeranyl pyrophosphate synthase
VQNDGRQEACREAIVHVEQAISANLGACGALNAAILKMRSAPGKRLRSLLLLGFASVESGSRELKQAAFRAAAAIEMIHEGSLVHDDIVDRSVIRRHQASTAAEFGIRTANHVGIYLVARGVSTLASLAAELNLRIDFALLKRLAYAQLLECLPPEASLDEQRARALEIMDGKTGALFALAASLGAQLASMQAGSITDTTSVEAYALNLARGFQIRDDVLDLTDRSASERPAGTDLRNGLCSWPVLHWALLQPLWSDTVARLRRCRGNQEESSKLKSEVLAGGAMEWATRQANLRFYRAASESNSIARAPGNAMLGEVVNGLLLA